MGDLKINKGVELQSYLVIVNIASALIQSIWHCLKIYRDCRYLFGVSLHSSKRNNVRL